MRELRPHGPAGASPAGDDLHLDLLDLQVEPVPTSASLDQAEQGGQGHQDRQDHQKDHEAGEEAGEHPPPLGPEQALDRRDDQPAREEAEEEQAHDHYAQPETLELDRLRQRPAV
jgi:hypothetical protein